MNFCAFFVVSVVVGGVAARVKTYDEWSAVLTSQDGSVIVASQVPDPVTGTLQPIVAINATKFTYIGPRKSYVGGVAQLWSAGSATYNSGSRMLDVFDLSANGWLAYPSTVVNKTASGTTTYSRNCTQLFNCLYVLSSTIYALPSSGAIVLEVNSRGTPLFMNVTYGNYYLAFTSFDDKASTYQPDPSIYTVPASLYDATLPQQPPNITTFSFHRSMRNDSFVRNIWNDNAATPPGEASWAGCQNANSALVFARFDLQIDQNFGPYAFCNGGACPCTALNRCQKVGVESPWNSPSPYPNAWWFSIPQAARCAKGFPIGTNNCSVAFSYKIAKSITAACFVATAAKFPAFNGVASGLCTGNLTAVGAYIDTVLDPSDTSCPDVTATLVALPDDS